MSAEYLRTCHAVSICRMTDIGPDLQVLVELKGIEPLTFSRRRNVPVGSSFVGHSRSISPNLPC